jgi:SHS2 domain-containing protein
MIFRRKKKKTPESEKINFQTFGKSIEDVFSNSLLAVFSTMYQDEVETKYTHTVKATGKNLTELLYNFLSEFIDLFNVKGMFLSAIEEIEINPDKMEVVCVFSGDLAKNYDLIRRVEGIDPESFVLSHLENKWTVSVSLYI